MAAAVTGGCIVRIRARKEVSNGNQDTTQDVGRETTKYAKSAKDMKRVVP